MKIQVIDPLADPRWEDLVNRHPKASVFHRPGWLKALTQTYGYQPLALTSAAPCDPLQDGIVFCRVSSWITGTRVVSVPFADHCEPLLGDDADLPEFIDCLRSECNNRRWKYVELRPWSGLQGQQFDLESSVSYWAHELDARPSLDFIARGLHKNSFRRKIRRAQKEGLSYESGTSPELVEEFYSLMVTTRRRHHLLPQPRRWFHNLVSCMGDCIQIRMARKDGIPIAALLTLRHQSRFVYKYGCSNKRYHKMGGMPFLFWKLIEDCKSSGVESIDLGRTDLTNAGLLTFKSRLGAAKKPLTYYRYTNPKTRKVPNWGAQTFGSLFSILPDMVLSNAGGLVYKHIG